MQRIGFCQYSLTRKIGAVVLLFLVGCAPNYPIVYKMQLEDNERLTIEPKQTVVITVNKDSVAIEKE